MAKLRVLGPVFAFEWLAVSRHWQWYAARSVFVLSWKAGVEIASNPSRDDRCDLIDFLSWLLCS